jgi:hypothetical protein
MITTIFSKSRPFNYIIVILALILCFFLVQIKHTEWLSSWFLFVKKAGLFALLIASLFIINFVTKRNGLSKDNTFPFLFFFLFLILFPEVLNNFTLVVSNFCVLLAMRRLISLQSLLTPKEKIFDASMWIFLATLFHFWSILYIVLVFASIILHVSRDYRNWILPYMAFFTVLILFVLTALIFDRSLINHLKESASINCDFNYFTNRYQNMSLSIFVAISVLFLFTLLFSLSNKPLIVLPAFKKIIISLLIGIAIFVISPSKNNAILIYTFMPLSIMTTSFLENATVKWIKETTSLIIVVLCIMCFVFQL